MNCYWWQDDAWRDNSKRDREKGGSTVRVFNSGAAMAQWRGESIPTEQELAEWHERYTRDLDAEMAETERHWRTMGMIEMREDSGAEVGAPAPAIDGSGRPAREPPDQSMTTEEYRAALAKLQLSRAQFADIVGMSDRTIKRYAAHGFVPAPVRKLIRLMLAGKVDPEDLRGM